MAHIFVSYLREDAEVVDKLADALSKSGIQVWLDREQIKPGERWQSAIRRAIKEGAFFIACFSSLYEERIRTYMNEELLIAISELRQRPVNRTWFIPVRLNDCSLPYLQIGPDESLESLQWVDLFVDFDEAVRRIANVIDPTGRLRRWSGPLNGLALVVNDLSHIESLSNRLTMFNIRLTICVEIIDFQRLLQDRKETWDFALFDTEGSPDDKGLRMFSMVARHNPEIVPVLVTDYYEPPKVEELYAPKSVLIKSLSLQSNWLAQELNVDIRRLMRERTT